ncbi:ABC transporter ATP-binding protein [Polluticoccus soli]|uniref:ABC transporter ATP-binding protein n=1 Tax=Polluticoccus soli TaxID=3034150 RepID=UPI0023E157F8|nr:ABC transporter ATP-binding protein [Flavipsychrobacter sp. JY13-12]
MKISLEHISKRFQRHWIFKEVSHEFAAPGAYAILGPNGSGKSTLLRIIAGMQAASKGKIQHLNNGKVLEQNKLFEYVSFCAPGMDIVEELTLTEFLDFHFSFKKALNNLSVKEIIEITGLKQAADKPIGDYSSGMKQRVKLAQAIFADTPLLLLDEPCSNLDQQGVDQYRSWIETYAQNRLVIVASNDVREYYFCKEHISIEDYK